MAIMKHSPSPPRGRYGDFDDLRRRMMQMFEEPFGMPIFGETAGWVPDVDMKETDGAILITAELPGMKKEDVHLEIERNVVTLSGEKQEEHEEKEKERYLYERSYGSFRRSFTLPTSVKEDEVRAEFHDGVLKVTLPKDGGPRGRKVEIAG
jgi:HSP20 family protein